MSDGENDVSWGVILRRFNQSTGAISSLKTQIDFIQVSSDS